MCKNNSKPAFVCQHILSGTAKEFFEAEGEQDRKDPFYGCVNAWCEVCDENLMMNGGVWDDRSEAFCNIQLMCDGCYQTQKDKVKNPELCKQKSGKLCKNGCGKETFGKKKFCCIECKDAFDKKDFKE